MARLEDLSLLDTGKVAILRDPETKIEVHGWVIADPLWKGKLAFMASDNEEVIDIFYTDEIEFL